MYNKLLFIENQTVLFQPYFLLLLELCSTFHQDVATFFFEYDLLDVRFVFLILWTLTM